MNGIILAAYTLMAQPGCMTQQEYVEFMEILLPKTIARSAEDLKGVDTIDTYHPWLKGYHLTASFKKDCLVEFRMFKEDDQ